MKNLEELMLLEKTSNVKLSCMEFVSDVSNEAENTRKRILFDKWENRYFYHEMKDGEVISCFEIALEWVPFQNVKIFAWTPDNLHICKMDSRTPGKVEFKKLNEQQIKPGMSCKLSGVEVEFVDDSHIKVNGSKINVKPDSGYVYKLLKHSIKANGGSRGLFSFLENCANEKFHFNVFNALASQFCTNPV